MMNITNILLLSDCCGALPLGEVFMHEVNEGENQVQVGEIASGFCSRCKDNTTFSDDTHRYWLRDHPEVIISKSDDGDEDRHVWVYEIRSEDSLIGVCRTLKGAKEWCAKHQLKASYQLF